MADKTDEPKASTGENPVYDSIVDGGEPVVATVDSEPDAADAPPALVEPEEIVVEESEQVAYVDAEPTTGERPTVVDETRVDETVVEESEQPASDEPFVEQPVYETPAAYTPPQPQVVYVNAPQAPVNKSNRGFGVLIAIAATLVFIVALVIVMAIVYGSLYGAVNFGYLGQAAFYVPALFFLVGIVALALILNRAGWWTHVIGSVVVALFVYFGTIAVLLLGSNVIMQTPEIAAEQFRQGLVDPFSISAALVAREVTIWAGAIIASRGRKVKLRNADAQAEFQREQASARGY